jgi:hypothetical protein
MKPEINCQNYKPELIESLIRMSEPNESVLIHEGEFVITNGVTRVNIQGKITFEWLPKSGAQFSGTLITDQKEFQIVNSFGEKLQVHVDGLKVADCYVTHYVDLDDRFDKVSCKIRGRLRGDVIYSDGTVKVETVRFSIPNLKELPGEKAETKEGANFGRLTLEDDKYCIIIDKSFDYSALNKRLVEKGGFQILYAGEIRCKKGPINAIDARITIHILSDFLSFLNGRRVSPLFATGIHNNEAIWCDYSDLYVSTYEEVESWPSSRPITDIKGLWSTFRKLWEDANGKTFLQSAIHWYIEANNRAAYTEGSIILAQTALELLYNWILIENKKLLLGKDAENLSASNKIRLLLAHLSVTTEVPTSFVHLKEFVAESNEITDAPEAIVQIRNAIVHSQFEKRKKLTSIHLLAKHQALQVSLWYIELALLSALGYSETYYNRCSPSLFLMAKYENVPWAEPSPADKRFLDHYRQNSAADHNQE